MISDMLFAQLQQDLEHHDRVQPEPAFHKLLVRPESVLRRETGGVPHQLNFQGVVTVHGARFNGTGEFYFALIDPDTGALLGEEEGDTIGKLKVTKVTDKISYCDVIEGEEDPDPGTIVSAR